MTPECKNCIHCKEKQETYTCDFRGNDVTENIKEHTCPDICVNKNYFVAEDTKTPSLF